MPPSKKAFTLVELIITLSIVTILSIVWAYKFTWYLWNLRDTSRLTQVTEIYNGVISYSINNRLPISKNSINITQSGTTIWYQWDFGENLLETIEFTSIGKDPKTNQYYTFSMDANRKNFQFMVFLEEQSSVDEFQKKYISSNLLNSVSANTKIPFSYWKNIGVIFDKELNPIHKNLYKQWSTNYEVKNNTEEYILQFAWKETLSSKQWGLEVLALWMNKWWVQYSSCSEMLLENPKLKNKDWRYPIIDENWLAMAVECNMTEQGWGWTKYAEIIDEFTFDLAKECYETYSQIQTDWFFCFNPNRKNLRVTKLMVQINQDYASAIKWEKYFLDVDTGTYGVWALVRKWRTESRRCAEKSKIMSPMSHKLRQTFQYIRLWWDFCSNNRQPGGVSYVNSIMNFSNSWDGPREWNGVERNRSKTVVPFSFYFK